MAKQSGEEHHSEAKHQKWIPEGDKLIPHPLRLPILDTAHVFAYSCLWVAASRGILVDSILRRFDCVPGKTRFLSEGRDFLPFGARRVFVVVFFTWEGGHYLKTRE